MWGLLKSLASERQCEVADGFIHFCIQQQLARSCLDLAVLVLQTQRHLQATSRPAGSQDRQEVVKADSHPKFKLTSWAGFPHGRFYDKNVHVRVVQRLRCQASTAWGVALIPGLGRFPRGGHGNPLQYSCLENPHGQRSLAGYSP